jgi:hypothetical protein
VDTVGIMYGTAVDTRYILNGSVVDIVFCTDLLWTLYILNRSVVDTVICTDFLWTMRALYEVLMLTLYLHYGLLVDTVYTAVCITFPIMSY